MKKLGKNSTFARIAATVVFAALTVAGAMAQTAPGANDWTGSIDDFKDDWGQMLNTNGPSLMGVLVLGLGFGFVWRKIKQSARS